MNMHKKEFLALLGIIFFGSCFSLTACEEEQDVSDDYTEFFPSICTPTFNFLESQEMESQVQQHIAVCSEFPVGIYFDATSSGVFTQDNLKLAVARSCFLLNELHKKMPDSELKVFYVHRLQIYVQVQQGLLEYMQKGNELPGFLFTSYSDPVEALTLSPILGPQIQ